MSDIVIKVEGLGKRYQIRHQRQKGGYVALRDVIADKTKAFGRGILSRSRGINDFQKREEFWALRDVDFEVRQGDKIGIIGRNGAGKSTLLKLLSRITDPTSGRILLKGRVASLLEVGTGFHPELTGRENIYLNGAVLGMGKREIRKKFDEIVAFSEVEKFLDMPVKRYSSGMYVRLAFSVAAHLEPEILLVDEVLAVGDAEFQKKCIGRMDEVSKGGRTILFVSHNLAAVQRLCNTGLLFESGRVVAVGDIAGILGCYQQAMAAGKGDVQKVVVRDGEARFTQWRISSSTSAMMTGCFSKEKCRIEFTIDSKRKIPRAFFGLAIWNLDGNLMLAASSLDNGGRYVEIDEGVYSISFQVRLPIKAGTYDLGISLNSGDEGQLDRWNAHPQLTVLPHLMSNLPEHWQGLVNEDVVFEFQKQV